MLRVRIHMGCYGALHNRNASKLLHRTTPCGSLSCLRGRWGRLSQPDISPAVWQLGPLTHKRLVAGRQSPLQGDKRLSISDVRHFRVVPRADIDAPVPPSICRANRGGAEAHGRVACARTLRGADARTPPQNQTQAFHWVTDRQRLHAATIKSRYARHTHVRTVPLPSHLG